MNTYTCPAEGCDYEGAKKSVGAHYSGKQDDDHEGGYLRAQELLEDADPSGEVTVDESPKPDDSTHDPAGDDPVMGSGPSFEEEDTDVEELPCGHETFDPSEAPEPPFRVSCGECGEGWTVTEL